MSFRPPTESPDSTAAPPSPDQFVLRVLVYLAFAGVVTGCALGGTSNAARWTILISIGAGLVAAMAHLLEILTRRLRTRMAELLGLLAVFAALLAVFSNSTVLLSGTSAEGYASSTFIAPLAATLLVLMLRETVLVRCAITFLPGLARTIELKRGGVVLKDELIVPPRWLYVVYWISPACLWMLGTALLATRILDLESELPLIFAGLLSIVLAVRVLVGAAAWFNAANALRAARLNGDRAGAREAAWYLGLNGFFAGGLLSFYGFALAGSGLQQSAMAQAMRIREIRVLAVLHKLMNVPSNTAFSFDVSTYAKLCKFPVQDSHWSTPESALQMRQNSSALRAFERNALIEPRDSGTDGSSRDYERNQPLLTHRLEIARRFILEERFAAEEGAWETVLHNTDTILKMAQQCHHSPYVTSWEAGCEVEDAAVMGLLTSTLWSEVSEPSDPVLTDAQKLIREYAEARGSHLIRHVRIAALERLRHFHQAYAGEQWIGWDVDLANLLSCWPVRQWRGQTRLYEFGTEFLRNYESDHLEAQRDDLLFGAQQFGDCDGHSSLPQFLPGYVQRELEVIADFRMTDAALALVRFEKKYHCWPHDLQDSVPEFLPYVPNDPFKPKSPVQFALNPVRVFCLGKATGYHPDQHGNLSPFDAKRLLNSACTRDNRVLFLGTEDAFRKLTVKMAALPGIDVPAEIKALRSSLAPVRAQALRLLATVDKQAAPAVDALVVLLADPDPEQRMFAAYILGQIGVKSDAVLSALRWARADPDADVRFFAKQALRRLDE